MKFVCVSFQEIAFWEDLHRDNPIEGDDDADYQSPELAKQYRRKKYLLKKIVDNLSKTKKEVEELEKVVENSIYATDEEEFVLELVSKLELF